MRAEDVRAILGKVESGTTTHDDAEALRDAFGYLLSLIGSLVARNCEHDGLLTSMYSPTYAEAIEVLADWGLVAIVEKRGNYVLARWRQ